MIKQKWKRERKTAKKNATTESLLDFDDIAHLIFREQNSIEIEDSKEEQGKITRACVPSRAQLSEKQQMKLKSK